MNRTQRSASRLLHLDRQGGAVRDAAFGDLPGLLSPGDLLVFNDTRVIKARLAAQKETGGRAEILVERIESDRVALTHIRASKSPKPPSLSRSMPRSNRSFRKRRGAENHSTS